MNNNKWFEYPDKKPPEDGYYLTVNVYGTNKDIVLYKVYNYSKDLHDVDKYDFDKNAGEGFYDYDSECGYHECYQVSAWTYIPEYEVKRDE